MMPSGNLVYIIGFMGCGKSTAGRKLAALLGWDFIDLDRMIEQSAGKTISMIFAEDGEEKFRKTESEVLKSLENFSKTVISTGGGTPCHGDNMDFMLSTGLTVYLEMKPLQLVSRLMRSSTDRPLIKNIPDEQLPGFIENKLAAREKWYRRAHIIIESNDLDVNQLSSVITERIKR